uniref:Uncharacterized protein n=1 Tax=Meloidogyne enterolobii TaxID=390850 RepID=A0A6V7V6C3_MELEN|nr:unnamed protein product [Meloidogyne enterolobii]
MDPKFNLAQTNMTRKASLTSLESGFVSLNELKTKEQMAVEIDLISNKIEEKKKDAEIFTKIGRVSNFFKELVEKARFNAKKSWTNCLSSINNNKEYLTSLFKIFLLATFLILVFILIMTLYYYFFVNCLYENIIRQTDLPSIILNSSMDLLIFFGLIYLYFYYLHKFLVKIKPNLATSNCFLLFLLLF